jgi:quercetin dioxygenase-like cupin family protein
MRTATRIGICLFFLSALVASKDQSAGPREKVLLTKDISSYTGSDIALTVRELRFPPSFQGRKHRHPGPLVVCVLEGSLEVTLEGSEPKPYSAGQCFSEEPRHIHFSTRNLSATAPARVISYLLSHRGEPLVLPEQ